MADSYPMSDNQKTYRIFLSAAEPSADSHCAALINSLKQSTYNIEFSGVGGRKMADAGCKLLQNTSDSAAMIHNAFAQVGRFYFLLRRINSYLQRTKPNLVIVCDSPAFNFHVAKAAKKHGSRTLFYVAPQLWAWAPWRIKKLHKYCDKLCCILPLEQNWFSEKGVDTTFVGNPLLDSLGPDLDANIKPYRDFNPENAHLALMPGSRLAEIDTLWKPMQEIAVNLRRRYPKMKITTVAVDDNKQLLLKARQIMGLRSDYSLGSVHETARQSDLALVASGSATLQVAAAGCPMIVMYQSSRLLWHLVGRWLINIKHLSLPNILADRHLVPEFMPYFASTHPILAAADCLLKDPAQLAGISRQLIALTKPLAAGNTAENVAQIACQMLD